MADKKEKLATKPKIKSTKVDKSKLEIELQGLASISKDVKVSAVSVTEPELKFLVDTYYQLQQHRIGMENQIRSIVQGYGEGKINPAIVWVKESFKNDETQIKKMLHEYAKGTPVGRWLLDINGIGPVYAAALISYFDITRVNHQTQFWSYAGLNDNNNPWLGTAGAKKEIASLKEEFPDLAKAKEIPDEVIYSICHKTHRTFANVVKGAKNNSGIITWTSLEKYLAKPPYNKDVKTLMWKIGQNFTKISYKEESLYGRLYRERKAYEVEKNLNGDYADQAAAALEKYNIGKDTDAYKAYSEGRLPDAHINRRAQRVAVKIFISHLFEAMWYHEYHEEPEKPYVLQYLGHSDYIYPEVDYRDY